MNISIAPGKKKHFLSVSVLVEANDSLSCEHQERPISRQEGSIASGEVNPNGIVASSPGFPNPG